MAFLGKAALKAATSKNGRKLFKGCLTTVLIFMFLIPTILFAPIYGLLGGVNSVIGGIQGVWNGIATAVSDWTGWDIPIFEVDIDEEDIEALEADFDITRMDYYKVIESVIKRHKKDAESKQKELAEQVREENSWEEERTDAEGNSYTVTCYPEVATPEPQPPKASPLAYVCASDENILEGGKYVLHEEDIKDFFDKIYELETTGGGKKFTVSVKYKSDDEIAKLFWPEDEGQQDFYMTSTEMFTQFLRESGNYGYEGTPSGNISDTSVAKTIWDYFKGKGWSDISCAALLGNIEAECSMNPTTEETGGTGIGICQWSFGRRTALLNWLSENGRELSDITAQCEYLLVENVWYAGTIKPVNGNGYRHTSKANSLTEFGTYPYERLSDAVEDFCWHWESPNYKYAQMDRRQGAAIDAYNMFASASGGNVPVGGSIPDEIRYGTHSVKLNWMWGGTAPLKMGETTEADMDSRKTTITVKVWDGSKDRELKMRVNKRLTDDIGEIFDSIYEEKIPIVSYDGGGEAFRPKNNVSNNKKPYAQRSISEHSYGGAIDLNAEYNPAIDNGEQLAGGKYGHPTLSFYENSRITQIFEAHGWTWGGSWPTYKDYMHFSFAGN